MSQPFKGDYLEITKNPKYQKLNSSVDAKVLLADVVNKINRANGKVRKSPPGCDTAAEWTGISPVQQSDMF